jgi:hypothetical protein
MLVFFLTALLVIQVVLDGAFALLDLLGATVLAQDLAAEIPEGAALAYLAIYTLLGLGMLMAYITTVVCFCIWIHRANRNARALGAEGMVFTPGWSVGWFFVPIMNLFKPFQATREIYQASEPKASGSDWMNVPVSPLLGWWWAAWLLSNFTAQFELRMSLSDDPALMQVSSWVGVASSILGAAAALLAMKVIRSIHQRQQAKARWPGEEGAVENYAWAAEG